MRKLRLAALAALIAGIAPIVAYAAGEWSTLPQAGQPSFSGGTVTGSAGAISSTTVPAGPPFLTGSEDIPADTNLPGGASPQTMTIPVTMLGNFGGTPRNYLDNGALNIAQRGTGIVTCAQNAGMTTAAYGADRWACSANVAVGAGRQQVITATPSPPAGFTNSMKVYRTSGALLQPVCTWQEVPTVRSTQLAGQTVTFSFYADALAGLAADNNNQITAVIISGTGSDEGLGTMTASPAITPAWTGITTVISSNITITTTFTRYAVIATIPATATEVGVGLCFTPTATGSGTTDGFAFTGAQLERGSGASPFEFRPVGDELREAQRYFTILTEPASGVQVPVIGNSTSATAAAMAYGFPVPMRVAPTFTALGTALAGTTWTNKCGNVNNALATTFIVTATANTVSGASLTVTSSGSTIGFGCVLVGAGGGSILSWSADF